MPPIRLLRSLALCTALAATGCSSNTATLTPETKGTVEALILAAPSAVQAVLVTVTGSGITGDVRATLTRDVAGHWSGQVINVPVGVANRVVTAYAYDNPAVPADPVADVAGLIFKGSATGVSVVSGQVASITVHLHPFPDGGGETGINTPPHLTALGHPAWIASNAAAALSATAVDPDLGAILTYTWSDGGAGGTFSGGSGNPALNKLTGVGVTTDYTPAADFVGQVTLRVTVTDGIATASTTFLLAVGAGVAPILVFDLLPDVTISAVQSQELVQGGSTTIDFALSYPAGAGPDALTQLDVLTAWTDSCGGTFDVASGSASVTALAPATQQVTYTAPPPGAPGSGLCELRLTVSDLSGSSEWSRVMAWVAPVGVVAGTWSGTVTDAPFGPSSFQLVLAQSGAAVTGSFLDGFSSGPVTGTVAGDTLTFAADLTSPGFCTGSLSGTATLAAGGTALDVSYTGTTTCRGPHDGAGTIARNEKVIFATRATHDGDFGGTKAAADAFCQAAADAGAVPPGTYLAFMSFPGTDAASVLHDIAYVLPDGTLVASAKADLLDGSIAAAIDVDELGVAGVHHEVWTGSASDGTLDPTWNQCSGWTSNLASGRATAGFGWTSDVQWIRQPLFSSVGFWCSDTKSLYCVQQ